MQSSPVFSTQRARYQSSRYHVQVFSIPRSNLIDTSLLLLLSSKSPPPSSLASYQSYDECNARVCFLTQSPVKLVTVRELQTNTRPAVRSSSVHLFIVFSAPYTPNDGASISRSPSGLSMCTQWLALGR